MPSPKDRIRVAFSRAFGARYSVDLQVLTDYSDRDQVWYSYRRLGQVLERDGLAVESIDRLSAGQLSDVRVLVIVRPTCDLDRSTLTTLRTFLQKGGSILIIQNYLDDEHPPHGTDVLAREGGILMRPLRETDGITPNVPISDATNFYLNLVDEFALDHPITAGVTRIAMHETCALEVVPPHATTVARGEHGVALAVARSGKGRLAVLADTEIFNDLLIGLYHNERLALNLFRWLAFNVEGADPVERLIRLLATDPTLPARLDPLTHLGRVSVSDAMRGGCLEERLFQVAAVCRPRDILRALFTSAELMQMEEAVSGRMEASRDEERIDRILRNLGFTPTPPRFGRTQYQQQLQGQRRALRTSRGRTRTKGAVLDMLLIFEMMMREFVLGYGAGLFPNSGNPLVALGTARGSSETDRPTMGTWHRAATRVFDLLASSNPSYWHWVSRDSIDWEGLRSMLCRTGQRLTEHRNRLVHGEEFDQERLLEVTRTFLVDEAGSLYNSCLEALPEVVCIESMQMDSLGRRVIQSRSDVGDKRHLVTEMPLSPAVTYYHFARTASAVSINPLLVQRPWL